MVRRAYNQGEGQVFTEMEQAFLQDEINYLEEEIDRLRSEQRHRWKIVMNIIS